MVLLLRQILAQAVVGAVVLEEAQEELVVQA
jgi:hypothetical protein